MKTFMGMISKLSHSEVITGAEDWGIGTNKLLSGMKECVQRDSYCVAFKFSISFEEYFF